MQRKRRQIKLPDRLINELLSEQDTRRKREAHKTDIFDNPTVDEEWLKLFKFRIMNTFKLVPIDISTILLGNVDIWSMQIFAL